MCCRTPVRIATNQLHILLVHQHRIIAVRKVVRTLRATAHIDRIARNRRIDAFLNRPEGRCLRTISLLLCIRIDV